MKKKIKKSTSIKLFFLVILFFIIGVSSVHAETYYVDSTDGSDSNNGTSDSTPWQTLIKVNDTDFIPGDSILFKRGETWRGQLIPQSGSEAGGHVTYGAYGEGDKPKILGSVNKNQESDWTDEGNNIWSAGGNQTTIGDEMFVPALNFDDENNWYSNFGAYDANGDGNIIKARTKDVSEYQNEYDSAPYAFYLTRKTEDQEVSSTSDIRILAYPESIEKDTWYKLEFSAKATTNFQIPEIRLTNPAGTINYESFDYSSFYVFNSKPEITTEWETYTVYFYSNTDADDVNIIFFIGDSLSKGNTIFVDAFSFKKSENLAFGGDVGGIFNGEEAIGSKRFVFSGDTDQDYYHVGLNEQGDFWYDRTTDTLKMYSDGNPASVYSNIECSIERDIVRSEDQYHMKFENLDFRYGAGHGLTFIDVHHVTIKNVDISFVGGGRQAAINNEGNPVRYGNGIDLWNSAQDIEIEGCYIHDIYDSAMGNEYEDISTVKNIFYRNNLIERCYSAFGIGQAWGGSAESSPALENIYFENNTILDSGAGWGVIARPDKITGNFTFGVNYGSFENIYNRNNIFSNAGTIPEYSSVNSSIMIWHEGNNTNTMLDAIDSDYNIFNQPNNQIAIDIFDIFYDPNNPNDDEYIDFAEYKSTYNKDAHSILGDPLLDSNLQLQSTSSAIDAGISTTRTVDILGNPIYGLPDLGAYEYQPPYTMGTDKIDIGAGARIYGDGKFRNLETTSGATADISVIPQNSNITSWLDVSINTWNTSGDYHKNWTENGDNLGDIDTLHTIGDLASNTAYTVKIDNTLATSSIVGDNCNNGICTSDSNGQITFTFVSGYSTHTFDIKSPSIYYIDSTSGNDNNDGLSTSTPWQTLTKVNDTTFSPGDSILFKRGETWRGQLIPSSGSEAGGYVTYGAYGEGDKPKILGSVNKNQESDWTDEGNNIWSAGGNQTTVGDEMFVPALDFEDPVNWYSNFGAYDANGDGNIVKSRTTAVGEYDPNSGSAGFSLTRKTEDQEVSSTSDIQILAYPTSIEKNTWYKLEFSAKSTTDFQIPEIRLLNATGTIDYAPSKVNTNPDITTEWNTYAVYFYSNADANDINIIFFIGNSLPKGATIFVDSFSFKKSTDLAFSADVGNIIFNDEESFGIKRWTLEGRGLFPENEISDIENGEDILNALIERGVIVDVVGTNAYVRPELPEKREGIVREIAGGQFDEVWAILLSNYSRLWSDTGLKVQGDFFYDKFTDTLKMYSLGNPVNFYSNIECALTKNIIEISEKQYVILENLDLRYGGAHGIQGENTHHIIIRNADISFVGGGYSGVLNEDGNPERYGNGIEFFINAHDNIVENCYIHDIYDTGLTNQSNITSIEENIYYRNNIIERCSMSFEIWNKAIDSVTDNIFVENNTFIDAGRDDGDYFNSDNSVYDDGYPKYHRPNPDGKHLIFMRFGSVPTNLYIRNNIFSKATYYNARWHDTDGAEGISPIKIDYNSWYQADNRIVLDSDENYFIDRVYSLAEYQDLYSKDLHSISGDPLLDSSFQLQSTSSAIDVGISTTRTVDKLGNPIYGLPDLGAYEYQPPYTIGTDEIDIGAGARIYGDGKFRDLSSASNFGADLAITPNSGNFESYTTAENRPVWLDISNLIWSANLKEWTESSDSHNLSDTTHTIGDSTPGAYYYVKVDNELGAEIIGDNCIDSICLADSNGDIKFTYTGNYSTHSFEITPREGEIITDISDAQLRINRNEKKTLNEDKKVYSNEDRNKLSGQDENLANGQIEIYKNDKKISTVNIDSEGKWSKSISFSKNKTYTIKLKFYDQFGTLRNEKEYEIKIDTEKPKFINSFPKVLTIKKVKKLFLPLRIMNQ